MCADVGYKVRIANLADKDLRGRMEIHSLVFRLQDHPPATMGQLERRVIDDLSRLDAVLHSEGYLRGRTESSIEAGAMPVKVLFTVERGPLYLLRDISVEYVQDDGAVRPPSFPRLDFKESKPATANQVVHQERAVIEWLKEKGYPFPSIQRREVVFDHDAARVDVVLHVRTGAFAVYGVLKVEGLVNLKAKYVHRRVPWREGEPFRLSQMEDFEQDLLKSGLFSTIDLKPQEKIGGDGALPILVRLGERRARTVRVGVGYRSDEGINGQLSWVHRNLFRGGEKLKLSVSGSRIEQGAHAHFLRPDFLERNLSFISDIEVVEETPDAYISKRMQMGMGLEYEFRRHLTISGGIAYKYSEVTQLDDKERYEMLLIPLALNWDRRDDELDATRGWQALLSSTPYKDLASDLVFGKHYIEGRVYLPVWKMSRAVLALRLGTGSITGANSESIPADERFYAGGGSTVRGYAYQSIGEVVDGVPLGGNSMLLTSAELRSKVIGKLGGTIFVDGGSISSESRPGEDANMRWAMGLGVNYDMGFAPLRFDIAFPINRRDIDDVMQFYISMGQAF